jgi:hypothetical protein
VVANKNLPKYPFERVVDAFLGVFLPDIVGQLWSPPGNVRLVAQEFPLKEGSNQSTNVDYLLRVRDPEAWVFLELKTDVASVRDRQAEIYANKLVGNSMKALLAELDTIASVTKQRRSTRCSEIASETVSH